MERKTIEAVYLSKNLKPENQCDFGIPANLLF